MKVSGFYVLVSCMTIFWFLYYTTLYGTQASNNAVYRIVLPTTNLSKQAIDNEQQILSLYRNMCHTNNSISHIQQPVTQFKSIVLVIIFNNPLNRLIPLLELMYRPLFPNIVYCVSNGDKGRNLKNWKLNILYYKSPPRLAGYYNYICVDYVHQLGLKADGFLFIADDVLVSPSAVTNFTRKQFPAAPDLPDHVCDIRNPSPECKLWTHLKHGAQELASLRRDLKLLPRESVGPICERAIQNMTGVRESLLRSLPDIFFIPSHLMRDASQLFQQFYKHRVYVAAAIYHVLSCLSSPSFPTKLKHVAVWDESRNDLTKTAPHVVSGHMSFVHPVKLSPLLKRSVKYDTYFCKTLLPFLHGAR